MTYDASRTSLWVVNTNDFVTPTPYRMHQVNPVDGSVIDTWDIPGGFPGTTYGLCMDFDPDYIWMVAGNTLYKLSIPLRQVVLQYTVPTASLLKGIVQVAANRFWMVDANNYRVIEVQIN